MNFCIQYCATNKCLKQADEISIHFKASNNLKVFLQEHTNQIINVIVDRAELDSWQTLEPIFLALAKEFPNFRVQIFPTGHMRDEFSALKSINPELPWFSGIPATNWERLRELIRCGATAVYIAEDLGFDAVSAAEMCHENGVKTRFIPNVATSSCSTTPSIKKFFIRPEDLYLYESIADTIEIWGLPERQDAYFKAYKERKSWDGYLFPFFYSFAKEENIEGDKIHPIFGKARLECKRRCFRDNRKCRICEQIIEFSEILKNKELRIKKRD